jgi:hypothetical protein
MYLNKGKESKSQSFLLVVPIEEVHKVCKIYFIYYADDEDYKFCLLLFSW